MLQHVNMAATCGHHLSWCASRKLEHFPVTYRLDIWHTDNLLLCQPNYSIKILQSTPHPPLRSLTLYQLPFVPLWCLGGVLI